MHSNPVWWVGGAGATRVAGVNLSHGGGGGGSVTFKEVVEAFALKHNVEFTPRIGKYYQGKQMWMFGRSLCHLDQNVVFVSTSDKGAKRSAEGGSDASGYGWQPIGLEELLHLSV